MTVYRLIAMVALLAISISLPGKGEGQPSTYNVGRQQGISIRLTMFGVL